MPLGLQWAKIVTSLVVNEIVFFVLCASLKNDSFSFLQKNDDDDDLKARNVVIIVISDYDLQLQSNACTECSEN